MSTNYKYHKEIRVSVHGKCSDSLCCLVYGYKKCVFLDLEKDYDFVVLEYDHKSSKAKEESFQKRRIVDYIMPSRALYMAGI